MGRSKMAYKPTTNSRTTTVAPPAIQQSGIRTVLIAAFAVVCVFWLCFLFSAAMRHDRADSGIHEPLSVTLLEIGFLLGPYAICMYFGFHSLNLVAVKGHTQAQRQKEQVDMNMYMLAMLARQKIVSLTACLIQNHMHNREQGYPASLRWSPCSST